MLSKLYLFVSLSREFSKYIKTLAAEFNLVQTVLHDGFAGVQSEINLVQNVSEEKICVRKKFSKISWKTRASFTSEQVIVSYPREILPRPL